MGEQKYVPALGYDRLTRFYDPVVRLTTRELIFKHALIAHAGLRPGNSILDLGCGSGTLAIMLKQHETGLNLFGLDGDSKILKIAAGKARQLDIEIRFVRAFSFQLPFPDDYFDHVFSSLFFHHLTREAKLTTLGEVRRVLKPGGSFHVADWGLPSNSIMKLASKLITAFDGSETTEDNFAGRLPGFIKSSGFEGFEETESFDTMFGTIRLHRATKSAV